MNFMSNWKRKVAVAANVLRLCAAALDKLNNSAPNVQRWRKTAVIGWCGNRNENEFQNQS